MKRSGPTTLFISYAHEDEQLRRELEKHLSLLRQQRIISTWHDRRITAGTDWSQEVDEQLDSASIILLLISADFMASQYCYSTEMKRAMDRHAAGRASVIPIILRPIDWKGAPFGKLQVLPTNALPVTSWPNHDEALTNIAQGIRNAVEKISATPLFPPQKNRAPIRRAKPHRLQELREYVRKNPFIAVIGPSGCGKSSLVFAGLFPRLRYEGKWQVATLRPGERPFQALAAAFLPLLEPQMDEIDRLARINKLAEPLKCGEITLYDVIAWLTDKHSASHVLLFMDQFEEIYTLCQDADTRQHFLDTFLQTIRTVSQQRTRNFTLVITLRADFLGQALLYRPFADVLQHNDLKLSPMNQQELYDAITKPAQQLEVIIEDGLAERIVDAVKREPGNSPLVEFTLTLLWAKQQEGRLTHSAYKEIGGIEQALASYAEDTYRMLSREEQQQAQRVFVQLVHPGEGTEDTRRLATRVQIGEEDWNVVARLADARLVVSGLDKTNSEEIVEIVHEALISNWQRLRMWIEANREFRIWQERLRDTLRQWEKSTRDEGILLHGILLVEATRWMTQRPEAISQQERMFIEASLHYQETMQERQTFEQRAFAAELMSTLGQSAYELTHRLGNSLCLIDTFADTIRAELGILHVTNSVISRKLESIVESSRTVLTFSNDLKDRLRNLIDHEEIDEPFILISPQELFEETKKQLFLPSSISLTVEAGPDVASVFVIRRLVLDVLYNLISNAVDVLSKGGQIMLRARNEGRSVALEVADTGPGIPEPQKSRIFELFFSSKGSSGFGLWSARRNALRNHGVLQVTSQPGEGATFTLLLPKADEQAGTR